MAIEHADFDGIERLALVTGGQIVSTFDNPEGVILGECEAIEQIMIGEDRLIKFSGLKAEKPVQSSFVVELFNCSGS